MQTLFLEASDAALQEAPSQATTKALQMAILSDAPWRGLISPDQSHCKGQVYTIPQSEP
ncbi:hypothetical protein [Nitrospira sp. Nam74]